MCVDTDAAGQGLRLKGRQIYLRPLVESDVGEEYLAWLNDPGVTRYLEAGNEPVTTVSLRQYLERFQNNSTDLIFAIIDQASKRHIGNVTLNHVSPIHLTAATGLMIGRKEFWGLGIAFEAWGLAIDYAFKNLGVRKVLAGAVSDNVASVKTLKKLGFRVEGTLRKEVLVEGQYRDKIIFGLFANEFGDSKGLAPVS